MYLQLINYLIILINGNFLYIYKNYSLSLDFINRIFINNLKIMLMLMFHTN